MQMPSNTNADDSDADLTLLTGSRIVDSSKHPFVCLWQRIVFSTDYVSPEEDRPTF